MSACTFFGHRECYGLGVGVLQAAIEDLVGKGVNTFYVGHQGDFDSMVLTCLKKLKQTHPQIVFSVVLAYLPKQRAEYDLYADCSIYLEGSELCHPKFAIERRNRWIIDNSDYCVCYIDQTWGGAYKFVRLAKRRGAAVTNLGNVEIK